MKKPVAVAIIRTDHSVEITHQSTTLQFLQDAVHGNIECLGFRRPDNDEEPAVLYCNEEGKLIGLPVNVIATELYRRFYGHYDILMGNVVLCGSDDEGNEADLPQWMFEEITKAVDVARNAMQ